LHCPKGQYYSRRSRLKFLAGSPSADAVHSP
jgi:hypothetical protein